MKMLKRALCLITATALLAGLLCSGAGAVFTDRYDIHYNNAVELLSSFGIIEGYDDGSFRPESTFDRAGLAKLVSLFCWGGRDESEQYKKIDYFADLEGFDWASGYINYGCATEFINGVGWNDDGRPVYDPGGVVLGYELAKTLLCAIGYKADAKNPSYALTGAAWDLNSIRIARSIGLFDGLGDNFDATKELTREEAAQMFRNTLGMKMVTAYNDDGSPKAPGLSAELAQTPLGEFFDCTAAVGTDDFYRMTTTYTKNGEETPVAVITELGELNYSAAVTSREIYAGLGLSSAANALLIKDGDEAGLFALSAQSGERIGGNGTEIRVYRDGDDIKITCVNTYCSVISAVTNGSAELPGGSVSAGEFMAGDVVLVTKTAEGVVSAVKARSAELTPTAFQGLGVDGFSAGGRVYEYSANFTGSRVVSRAPITAYLDEYGYVISLKLN